MSNLIKPQKYYKQAQATEEYLNMVVGLISFTLAFTCLSFDNSSKIALLCFPVVISLFLLGLKFTPSEMKALNEIIKETNSKEAIKEKNHYLGNKALLFGFMKCSLYIYGLVFYLFVLCIPSFVEWVKT